MPCFDATLRLTSVLRSQTSRVVGRAFGRRMTTELVHHRRYKTREVAEYIDLFYNRERRQARLEFLSPAAYTQLFTRQQAAA